MAISDIKVDIEMKWWQKAAFIAFNYPRALIGKSPALLPWMITLKMPCNRKRSLTPNEVLSRSQVIAPKAPPPSVYRCRCSSCRDDRRA